MERVQLRLRSAVKTSLHWPRLGAHSVLEGCQNLSGTNRPVYENRVVNYSNADNYILQL